MQKGWVGGLTLGSPGLRPRLILPHQSSVHVRGLTGTGSAIGSLCELGQVTPLLWVSVFSAVKHLPDRVLLRGKWDAESKGIQHIMGA